jgi:hypothetical protein
MKRVLRSCLDPLPRILSTRGLAAIVLLVLSGTALSVHEYVESGRVPDRSWPRARTVQSGAQKSHPRCASAQRAPASAASAIEPCSPPCTQAPAVDEGSAPSGATVYRPDESRSGT